MERRPRGRGGGFAPQGMVGASLLLARPLPEEGVHRLLHVLPSRLRLDNIEDIVAAMKAFWGGTHIPRARFRTATLSNVLVYIIFLRLAWV